MANAGAKENVNLNDNPYFNAFLSCYQQLVVALPMDAMHPTLVSKGLLREASLQQQIATTRTDYGKARLFLDSMTGGLRIGVTDTFKMFLEAMDEYAKNTDNVVVRKLLNDVNEHLATSVSSTDELSTIATKSITGKLVASCAACTMAKKVPKL